METTSRLRFSNEATAFDSDDASTELRISLPDAESLAT